MASPISCTVIAREKNVREKLHVIHQTLSPLEDGQVRLRVDLLGLSANNKFYMDFGDDATFCFNSAYPLDVPHHQDANKVAQPLPPLVAILAWGLATVVESKVPEIEAGQKYRGFLHLTDIVQFSVKRSEDEFIVVRDKLYPSYNVFTKVTSGPLGAPKISEECGIALTTLPGSLTGFCLSEFFKKHAFYGAETIVFTSASSKVSLAAAFFLKRAAPEIQLVGWTNKNNKEFCLETDLFESVFEYEEDLDKYNKSILVDVAGRFDLYEKNKTKFLKAFTVGNTNEILGGWLNPKLEPYLVMDTLAEMMNKLGKEGLNQRLDVAVEQFVEATMKNKWMSVRFCDNMTSIQLAQNDICKGTVLPSEAVVLDMVNAVLSKKKLASKQVCTLTT